MGFFDRFTSKKPERPAAPPSSSSTQPASAPPQPTASPVASASSSTAPTPISAGGIRPRLEAAREKLDLRDLPGAMALYEEVLGAAGDRADVLVTISGDLGSHGHVSEIIELIAPRYDADRHGPATGLNLLQAYLAVRNADAAQHVLDILFALNRPELEDRLHGFSNAIAEILAGSDQVGTPGGMAVSDAHKIGLITLSKPIWFYGLEPLGAQLLPPKEGRLRRIAFAQLALPGYAFDEKSGPKPEDELTRLSRAIPLWFHETFYFSAAYAPVAAVAIKPPVEGQPGGNYVVFTAEWTTENLRQLVESHSDGLDYIVTGSLRATSGDYEVTLRAWEVKTFRERKTFNVRWTPGNADAALVQLHGQVRGYMEWSPASAAFAYTNTTQPRTWLDTLGASLGLFLVEKNVLTREQLAPVGEDVQQVGRRAAGSEAASFAYLTLRRRAMQLGLASPGEVALARSPFVAQAAKLLA
jgi:hypothetical protein